MVKFFDDIGKKFGELTDAVGDFFGSFDPGKVPDNPVDAMSYMPRMWWMIASTVIEIGKLVATLVEKDNEILENVRAILMPLANVEPLTEQLKQAAEDVKNIDLNKAIQSPNLDPEVARSLSSILAIPYVGDIVRNEIEIAWMKRYQNITGRGFPTSLDQLHYFVTGGASPTNLINEIVSHIPDFYLDHNYQDYDKYNKGYEAARKAHKAGKTTFSRDE